MKHLMNEAEIKEVANLATEGLLNEAAHHKQWYLEKILVALGINLAAYRCLLGSAGYTWEDGIAP